MSDKRRKDDTPEDESVIDDTPTETDGEAEAKVAADAASEEVSTSDVDDEASESADAAVEAASSIDSSTATEADDLTEQELEAVGMFIQGEGDEVDLDSIELPPELQEPTFAEMRRNNLSWIVLGICTLSFVFGGAFIWSKEDYRVQVQFMFEGGLNLHKRGHIIELKERYRKEDHYCQNRYGEFKMMYSPRDAVVSVKQYKYKETLNQFMARFIRGAEDKREKIGEVELKKFNALTTGLKERQVVAEQNIKNLPLTQRTNEKDPKACTSDPEDYCTYVYEVSITKDKYRPRNFVIFSEYSPEAPNYDPGSKQKLIFKKTGASVYEVVWPGADLQPTPELFQEQYVQVMTEKIKCGYKEQSKTKELKELMALPDEERYQQIFEQGLLNIKGKTWTLSEWRASIAELKAPENQQLWTAAEAAIKDCNCKSDPPCWKQAPAASKQ